MKNWKIPGIILFLLIVAMIFRWSTVSSQTLSDAVIKFERDNWNGSIYQTIYGANVYREKLVQPPSDYMWLDSQILTVVWVVLAAVSIIWLLFSVSRIKKDATKDNIAQ